MKSISENLLLQISREPIVGASDFHVSEQLHVPSVVHHAVENGCDEHSQSQCSSIVLEHIFQSLSDQGGIGQCIQNALARHAREIDNTKAKVLVPLKLLLMHCHFTPNSTLLISF